MQAVFLFPTNCPPFRGDANDSREKIQQVHCGKEVYRASSLTLWSHVIFQTGQGFSIYIFQSLCTTSNIIFQFDIQVCIKIKVHIEKNIAPHQRAYISKITTNEHRSNAIPATQVFDALCIYCAGYVIYLVKL